MRVVAMTTATEIAEIVLTLGELEVGEQQLQVAHAETKDVFAWAVVAQGSQGSSSAGHHGHTRLTFREAQRHVPKDYAGKSASFGEFSFKIESYMTALDPTGWEK